MKSKIIIQPLGLKHQPTKAPFLKINCVKVQIVLFQVQTHGPDWLHLRYQSVSTKVCCPTEHNNKTKQSSFRETEAG
uniref:Uncharacterized protein n=1 Tax=Rhizophora mucronata TaxID=61149 RepID=A0A2P2NSA7_RHIMU